MYDILVWKDHATNPDNYYQIEQVDEDHVVAVRAGTVIQQGTNLAAENFNRLERGVLDATIAAALLTQHQILTDHHLSGLDEEVAAEVHNVVLTNSLTQPFNDSAQTIAFTKTRKNLNYIVEFIVTGFENGCVGDIIISDKAINGFKVAFDGSASKVTGRCVVKGGIY